MANIVQFKAFKKRKRIHERLLPPNEEFFEKIQMDNFVNEIITLISKTIENGQYGRGYHGMSLADIQVMPYQECYIWILGKEFSLVHSNFLNELDLVELIKKLEYVNRRLFNEGIVMKYSYTECPRIFYITLI